MHLSAILIHIILSEHTLAQMRINGVPLSSNSHSFTSAIKNGQITANIEQVLFESNYGQQGVLTEQWSGGGAFYDESTIISIYIDNETIASIEYNLLLGHGMGFTSKNETNTINNNGPFGTKYISHEASNGGLSHRYLIPFTKHIRITAKTMKNGTFWYWIHGIYDFPVILTPFNIEMPINTKLILYKQVNIKLTSLEYLTMANVTNKSGILFGFTIAANSSDFTYLEACLRIKIDDDDDSYQFLSSGTEDVFLSSYYFDSGVYHSDESGLTFKSNPGIMSAYKFFDHDPMIFQNSMQLVWRCGEVSDNDPNVGCPTSFGNKLNDSNSNSNNKNKNKGKTNRLKYSDTVVTTYTWVYQY